MFSLKNSRWKILSALILVSLIVGCASAPKFVRQETEEVTREYILEIVSMPEAHNPQLKAHLKVDISERVFNITRQGQRVFARNTSKVMDAHNNKVSLLAQYANQRITLTEITDNNGIAIFDISSTIKQSIEDMKTEELNLRVSSTKISGSEVRRKLSFEQLQNIYDSLR